MGRTKAKRLFKLTKNKKRGQCRLTDNGKICRRKTHCRELCSRHHTYMLRLDLMAKWGGKLKYVYFKDNTYEINKKTKPGKCRIEENGKNCTRKVHGRGLCARHWLGFQRRDLLHKFGTASRKDPRTFVLKSKFTRGICRVKENAFACNTKSQSRGLCSKHYLRFLRTGQLTQFGKFHDEMDY